MSWTVTARGNDTQSASSADLTSDNFTPAAEALLLALIHHNAGSGTVNGVAGHGTWARIAEGLNQGADGAEYDLWACITGGSPSAATIAVDINYQNKVTCLFLEVDETAGFDATLANNFGTPAYDPAYGSNRTATATVAAFGASTHMALGFCVQRNGAPDNWTPETGYTKMTEIAGNDYHLAVVYKTTEDTTISADNTTSSAHTSIMGIEVKHAAGGASPVSGSGTPATPLLTFVGTGSVANPADVYDVGGPVDLTLPITTLTGTGISAEVFGSGSPATPLPTLVGTGISGTIGSGGLTTPLPTLSGSGNIAGSIIGSGAFTLPMPLLSGNYNLMGANLGSANLGGASLSG